MNSHTSSAVAGLGTASAPAIPGVGAADDVKVYRQDLVAPGLQSAPSVAHKLVILAGTYQAAVDTSLRSGARRGKGRNPREKRALEELADLSEVELTLLFTRGTGGRRGASATRPGHCWRSSGARVADGGAPSGQHDNLRRRGDDTTLLVRGKGRRPPRGLASGSVRRPPSTCSLTIRGPVVVDARARRLLRRWGTSPAGRDWGAEESGGRRRLPAPDGRQASRRLRPRLTPHGRRRYGVSLLSRPAGGGGDAGTTRNRGTTARTPG